MKTIIQISIFIVLFLFLAKTSIQFNPFKISCEGLFRAIGFVFIIIGASFIEVQQNHDQYKKGREKGIEIEHDAAIEAARQIIQESKTKIIVKY